MKFNVKQIVTFILVVMISLSVTGIFIHQVLFKTLLNKEWLLHQYETTQYYEQLSDAVDDYVSQLLDDEMDIHYKFKDIISALELKGLLDIQTEQLIAYETNALVPTISYDFSIFENRIIEQLEIFDLNKEQMDTIVGPFMKDVSMHFYSIVNNPDYRPTDQTIWVRLIELLSELGILHFLLFNFVVASVSLVMLQYRKITELLFNIVYGCFFTSISLIVPFVWAHNLNYDRSVDSVISVKLRLFYVMLNDFFKLMYTCGYYILIASMFMYMVIVGIKSFKYYEIMIFKKD